MNVYCTHVGACWLIIKIKELESAVRISIAHAGRYESTEDNFADGVMGKAGRCVENVKRKTVFGGNSDIDKDKSLEWSWLSIAPQRKLELLLFGLEN